MIDFFKNKTRGSRGFTLVESLVSIALFSLAVVALVMSLGRGISDTDYAQKKMTAEYLAAEGVEDLRNMRDTYLLFSGIGAGPLLPPIICR